MNRLVIDTLHMPQLDRERTIRVYLPESYASSGKAYPVVYMHDGQNLFDVESTAFGMSWEAHTALDRLVAKRAIGEWIIVGIDNAGDRRLDEYSPWRTTAAKRLKSGMTGLSGGEGEAYADFVIHTLKPQIDRQYRTLPGREATAMIGSSMGGLISLYIGLKHQELFSRIGAFSTAVWFAEEQLYSFIESRPKAPSTRIYLDIGTEETSNSALPHFPKLYLEGTMGLHERLRRKGYGDDELRLIVEEGAPHNELSWARRLPDALEWLLRK